MSASQKNTYLEEVVNQKEQIERELKAQRMPQAPMRQRMVMGNAVQRAEDTGAFRALAAPAAGAAAASSAVDVRITGFWRWKNVIVPPNALVVHTRRGIAEPLHCGLGVSFRFDPVTDAFLAVPAAMQTLILQAKCVCRERQGVMVQGYVQWIIDDFRVAYQKLDFTDVLDPMRVVNVQLREQAEAAIKDTVSMMSIDQVLGDKQPIIRELTTRLRHVAEGEQNGSYEGLGLKIVTVQIKEAVVSSQQVWEALQRPFRAERSRDARLAELASEAVVRAKESEEDKARARTRIETEAEISRLRAGAEAESFDREVAERVRRAEREAETLAAVQAHETKKIEAEAAVARLKLRHELDERRAREDAEHHRAERTLALEAARRKVENDVSRAALEARLIEALPEVAEKMPRPNELRAISVGAPEGLTGLVQGVLGLLERGRGGAAGGGGSNAGLTAAGQRAPRANGRGAVQRPRHERSGCGSARRVRAAGGGVEGGVLGDAGDERLVLVPERGGQPVTEALKERALQLGLVEPDVGVDVEELLNALGAHVEALEVDRLEVGHEADGGGLGGGAVVHAVGDPLEDANVVTKARPEELALVVGAEPVHVKDARQLFDALLHREPMAEVVGHVVPTERNHGHRVIARDTDLAGGGGGGLADHGGADEDAVLPVEGLEDERGGLGAAAAEDDGRDGHAARVVHLGADAGALFGGHREAAVRVGGLLGRAARPGFALPVGGLFGGLFVGALPPGLEAFGESGVGEDGVALE